MDVPVLATDWRRAEDAFALPFDRTLAHGPVSGRARLSWGSQDVGIWAWDYHD
jgi:hypothetical protein